MYLVTIFNNVIDTLISVSATYVGYVLLLCNYIK